MNSNNSKFIKEWTEKFNPFNSDKYIAQAPKWKTILYRGEVPPPTTISVDPVNICNLRCTWCNAEEIIHQNHPNISTETLMEIADMLPEWPATKKYPIKGVEALCLSGGGENLLHPAAGEFLQRCYDNGIKTALVTNGTQLHKHLSTIANCCTWAGVSVDAGTRETFKKLKGKDLFDLVITNIANLIDYSKTNNTTLATPGLGPGVGYKYLLHPGNVQDVYEATRIAREIGCKSIHIRPYGVPWFVEDKEKHTFEKEHLEIFKEQITKARELEREDEYGGFKVYGITHKFSGDFTPNNNFNRCHSPILTGVIMPPSSTGKFDYGFCFDRRGDPEVTVRDLNSMEDFYKFWGSKEFWNMYDKTPNPQTCPRCTLKPHIQIYEQMVQKDNTTFEFI
jgi:pyruvate-formate lyase-activating enzyme